MFSCQDFAVDDRENILHIQPTVVSLFVRLCFCLFCASEAGGVDREFQKGVEAAGDPFGLVVTSLPFFAGMQGNGDKEVYGTFRTGCSRAVSAFWDGAGRGGEGPGGLTGSLFDTSGRPYVPGGNRSHGCRGISGNG